jgi:transcription antitermination factor NusG
LVAIHLRKKGYDEYLPLDTSRLHGSDRTKTVETPLFSGYTFCKFDFKHRLPILIVPGVLHMVGTGKVSAAISEAEISSIQRVTSAGLHCTRWPFVQVGQSVSIERGPLAGICGTVVETESGFSLVVSVALLQLSIAVELDEAGIESIPQCHETGLLARSVVCGNAVTRGPFN